MNWNFGVSFLIACMAMPVLAQDSSVTASPVASPVISDTVIGSSIDTKIIETAAVAPPLAPLSEQEAQAQKEKAIQDSIAAVEASMTVACASLDAQSTPLAPKGEFETSDAYAKRQSEREKLRAEKCSAAQSPWLTKRKALQASLEQTRKQSLKMQGSLEIESTPKGARVWVNGKDMGKTPLTISNLWKGKPEVSLILDGYRDYVAVPEIHAGKATELEVELQEKSIFSQEKEVDLRTLLKQDTAQTSVYNARKELLAARIAQIDSEVQVLYGEFALKHPLTAKGEFETQAAYDKRQAQWEKDNQAKNEVIQKKYNAYRTRLKRAIEVLEDYTLALEAAPKTKVLDISGLTLQSYNADAGKYSLVAQSSDASFAFRYDGFLSMSLEEAKMVNKQTTGMDMALVYYDVPVIFNGTPVYPALNSITISKAGKKLATEGVFVLPQEWQGNVQIMAASKRADSLRKGLLVPRKLDAAYALDYQPNSKSSSRTWMYVARSVLFVAGAAGLSYGYLQQRDADDLADNYDPINSQDGINKLQDIRDKEALRNNSYIAGSALMLAGVVTFAF